MKVNPIDETLTILLWSLWVVVLLAELAVGVTVACAPPCYNWPTDRYLWMTLSQKVACFLGICALVAVIRNFRHRNK